MSEWAGKHRAPFTCDCGSPCTAQGQACQASTGLLSLFPPCWRNAGRSQFQGQKEESWKTMGSSSETEHQSASPPQTLLGGLKLFTPSHQDKPLDSLCPYFLFHQTTPKAKRAVSVLAAPLMCPNCRYKQKSPCSSEPAVRAGNTQNAGDTFQSRKPHFDT